MQFAYSPYALLPFITFVIALVLIKGAWQYRTENLGRTFVILMLALAWWSMSVSMEHLSVDLSAKVLWMKASYFGITLVPVGWLMLALTYTDKANLLTKGRMALLVALPAATLLVVWTNGAHHMMWKEIWLDTSFSPPVDAVTHGVWFWIYATYAYSLIVTGTVCLLLMFYKSKGVYRMQAGALVAGAFVPWIGNLLYVVGVKPFNVIDPTPFAFALTGIAFYWGLYSLKLLDLVPVAHEAVTRSMADGVIVLDTRQRIVDLNPAAERIAGLEKADAVGRHYSLVLPGQAGLLELKPDIPAQQGVIALGKGDTLRYYRMSVSSTTVRHRVSGYALILHDDTERMRAEAEYRGRVALEVELNERRRSEEGMKRRLEFEEAIARISSRFVGIAGIDRAINESLAEVGALSGAGRAYLFLVQKDRGSMDNTHEWCAEGVTPQIEKLKGLRFENYPWWVGKLAHGEAIHVADASDMPAEAAGEKGLLREMGVKSVLALPLFVKGRLHGFIGLDNLADAVEWSENDVAFLRVCSDILGSAFERKEAADQLARLNKELWQLNSGLESKVEERTRQLEEAAAVAEASSRAKSEFLASMSHELRTPLNAVIGFSQVLQERYFGELNEKQAEYVSDIVTSGQHLLSLINDILDLSKIEAGKMELDPAPVKIADLIRNSLVMVKEKALVHGIDLDVVIGEDIGAARMLADERRLKQVMFNLLSNAIKFTPDGGSIKVQAGKEGSELVVCVKDTGIGMSPQEQKRLFEAFYQASGGIKGKTPGTGLGLAITKSIIEKHGGRIWMESEGPNKGSRFSFALPFAPVLEVTV